MNDGVLERIAQAISPVHGEMFPLSRASKNPGVGRGGDISAAFFVAGKSRIVVEIEGLSQLKEGEAAVSLGDIVFEATINRRKWFELFRVSEDGIYSFNKQMAPGAFPEPPINVLMVRARIGKLSGSSPVSAYLVAA